MASNGAKRSELHCIKAPKAQVTPTIIGDLIESIQRHNSPFTSSRSLHPGVGSAYIHRLAILCTPKTMHSCDEYAADRCLFYTKYPRGRSLSQIVAGALYGVQVVM